MAAEPGEDASSLIKWPILQTDLQYTRVENSKASLVFKLDDLEIICLFVVETGGKLFV